MGGRVDVVKKTSVKNVLKEHMGNDDESNDDVNGTLVGNSDNE